MAFSDTKGEHNGTNGSGNKAKDTKGRKDAGVEVEPNPQELMKSLPRLKGLLETKKEAAAAYNKARKAAAKKCGLQSTVVDVAVRAYAGEKEDLELATRTAEQLSLVFEALAAAQ